MYYAQRQQAIPSHNSTRPPQHDRNMLPLWTLQQISKKRVRDHQYTHKHSRLPKSPHLHLNLLQRQIRLISQTTIASSCSREPFSANTSILHRLLFQRQPSNKSKQPNSNHRSRPRTTTHHTISRRRRLRRHQRFTQYSNPSHSNRPRVTVPSRPTIHLNKCHCQSTIFRTSYPSKRSTSTTNSNHDKQRKTTLIRRTKKQGINLQSLPKECTSTNTSGKVRNTMQANKRPSTSTTRPKTSTSRKLPKRLHASQRTKQTRGVCQRHHQDRRNTNSLQDSNNRALQIRRHTTTIYNMGFIFFPSRVGVPTKTS